MPDLSKVKVTSPIETFREPIYHRYGSTIGAADTSLGRLPLIGNTYYDKSFAGYDNQVNDRFANQGWLNAVGNFAADVGVKTLSGVPGLLGGITGLAGGGLSAATGGSFADGFNDNPFLNMTEAMNAWGEEHFPHMLEEGYHDKTFLQQLNPFESGGQILTSNVSTLGFLAQSFATAGIGAAVGIGARVAPMLGKVKNFRNALTMLESSNLAKIASNIDDLALNTFLTTNEAAMEALEAKNTAMEKLTQDRIDGKNTLSDQQIEALASSSQANVFWGNMLSLGVTNYAFGKLVSPLFSPKAVSTRANKWALGKATGVDQLVDSPKKLSKFERFLFDEGHSTGMAVKALATQALTEGPEESIQMSIQKVNDVYEGKKDFLRSYGHALKDFALHGFDLSDQERQKAFGLGSIIGAGSTAVMMATPHGPNNQAKRFREARENYLNELNKAYTDFNSYSLVAKEKDQEGRVYTKEEDGVTRYFVEEADKTSEVSQSAYQKYVEQFQPDPSTGKFVIPGRIQLDDNGAPIKDTAKMADMAASAKYHAALDNLIDVEASRNNPDKTKLSLFKKQKINDLASKAFKSGTTGILMEKLDEYKNISDERLNNEGYESRQQLNEEIDQLKSYVERLEKNYLSTTNGLVAPPKIADSDEFKQFREEAYNLGQNIVSLDALIEEVNQDLANLKVDNPEITERLSEIARTFESSKIDSLFPYTTDLKDEAAQTQAAQLVEKKKEIIRMREKMGEAYTKFFNPKEGFKAWKKSPNGFKADLGSRTKLFLNDKLTEEDFNTFVKEEMNFERFKEADKRASSVFYSDAINKFVHFMVPEGFTADSAESLTKLVTDIIDKEVQIYPDEAEKLKGFIDTFNTEYLTALDSLQKKADSFGIPLEELEWMDDLSDEEAALLGDYLELEKIRSKLSPLLSNLEKIKEKIDALTGMNFDTASESQMLDAVMDRVIQPYSKLISIAQYNGETIAEDFVDLSRVRQAKESLGVIINKALKPKAKKDKSYEPYLQRAEKLLKDLAHIEQLTKANIQDRELKEQRENDLYASAYEGLMDFFGIDKTDFNTVAKISKPLAAMAVPHIVKNKVKEPQVVIDSLRAKAMELLNGLTVMEAGKSKAFFLSTLTEEEKEAAVLNPSKAFATVWSKLLKAEREVGGGANIKALEDFDATYDILALKAGIESFEGVTPKEELQLLLDTYLQLLAVSQVEAVVGSNFSDVDYLGKLIKTLGDSKESVVPSQGQMRVLRELSIFFNSSFKSRGELFDNVAALKAPAGAGKSLVVAKYFKLLNSLKDSEIFTAAPHALAADNIARSVSSTHGANTIESLIESLAKGVLPKQVRLILLDEAGAVTIDQFNALTVELAKYNRRNPDDVVKMVMLYDPNQITQGNVGTATLETNSFYEFPSTTTEYWNGSDAVKQGYRTGETPPGSSGTGLNMVHNITQISPLSTTYRSDVVEIGDLQNEFKTDRHVSSVSSSASSNPLAETRDILGTFAEKGSSIADVFVKSQKQNPQRSRVVIVGSQAKKDDYQRRLPGAEVLFAYEAQGITRDEVYVDITEGDSSSFDGNPRVYNQYMYTALSRAVSYLHVANAPAPTFFEDKAIPQRVEELSSKKENIKDARIDTLKKEQEALKNILGEEEKVEVKPEEIKPEEIKEQEESSIEDEPQDVPTGDVLDLPVPEGFHSLRRPNSKVFEENGNFDTITAKIKLELAKDISNGLTRYLILQTAKDGKGKRVVAVLEESEVGEVEETLGISISNLTGHVFRKDLVYGDDAVEASESVLDSVEVYVGGTSGDIQYVYQYEPTISMADSVDEEGVLTALPLLERHLQTMFGPDPRVHLEDYDEVIENFEKYTKLISYTSDKQILLDFSQGRLPGELTLDKLPKKHVPYLVIENIKLKNSSKPLAKQFIRLQTQTINSNDAFMAPIYSFISKVEDLEKLLAGLQLPGKYNALRNGVGIQTDALNTYYPFHAFVAELSNAYKASLKGEQYTIHMSKEENIQTMFPDMDSSAIPADILKLAYEVDVAVHGEVEDKERRAYQGEAQLLMNSIGAQNLVVSTVRGTNILLRDYRTVGYAERGEVTESAGVSLLGPIKFQTKGRSYNPLVKDKLRVRLQSYYDQLVKKGLENSSRGLFIKGILNTQPQSGHLTPVTTAQLRELFVDSADAKGVLSNVSNGFGLRRPLKKDLNAKIDFKVLKSPSIKQVDASYLTTTFDKVIPTRITITRSSTAEETPLATPPLERRVDSPLITLKKQIETGQPITADTETKEQFTRIMGATSFDEAVELYKDRMSEKGSYTFSTNTIHGATREFYHRDPNRSLEESIKAELQSSFSVIGVGRQEGKTAARDYIRLTILARMFPNIPYVRSKRLVDIAREYYNVNEPNDHIAFDNVVEDLASSSNTNVEAVKERLRDLVEAYSKILEENDIDYTIEEGTTLQTVQSLVMASSKYREHVRAQQTPPIQAEGFEKFLRDLIEAGEQDADLFYDIVKDPANKAFMDKLGANQEDPYDAYNKAVDELISIEDERSFLYTEDAELGELLSDQEVSDLLDKLYPPKYSKFIDRLLSFGKNSAAKRYAMFNVLQNSKGQKVWGLYKNGVMSFVRHSSGKVGKKVVLHEYFHKVFWEFLSKAERIHLLNLARQQWGNLTVEELEERMADDFMNFVPNPQPSIFARFWQFLRRLLGFSRAYMSSIEEYYDGIYKRKFSPTGETNEVERSLMNILSKYDTLEQYYLAKTILMNTYKDILDSRKASGRVLSLEEAANETFARVKQIKDNPSLYTDTDTTADSVKEALEKTLSPRTELAWRNDLFSQTASRAAAEAAFNEDKAARLEKNEEILEQVRSIKSGDADILTNSIEALLEDSEANSIDELEAMLEQDSADISAETFDSELRDPKIKLTGSVKQKLLSITYIKNGKRTFGELDRTYAILLSKLSSLPTTSLEQAVSNIRNTFMRYNSIRTNPNIEQATGRFMFETSSRLLNQLSKDSLTRKDVSFRKDVTLKGMYAVVSLDGSNSHSVTRHEAKQQPTKYLLIDQEIGTTTDAFINKVSAYAGIQKAEVADSYYFFEDLDFMRSLLSAVASLQQSNPHVAFQWWDYGKYKTSIYKIKMSGGVTALQGRIISKFTDYASTIQGDELFAPEFLAKFHSASKGSRQDKIDAIASFLELLGLPFKKKVLQEVQEETLNNGFKSMLPAMESMSNQFALSVDSFDSDESWIQNRAGNNLLKEEFGFLSGLASILNNHYGLIDNNSYTRGDGKKAYGYRDESYQSSVFTSIARAYNGLAHRSYPTFKAGNGQLSSTDRFLKDNVFMSGKNRIFGFIDYDSKKTKNNPRFAKYLRKETLGDFRERHFGFGFLTRLRQSKGGSYYQFMPIPSNRTSIQAVEVGVLKTTEAIDAALLQIIKAQKNRPSIEENPDLASTKTYVATTEVTYKNGKGEMVTERVPNYKLWKFAGLEGNVDSFTEAQALARVKQHVKEQVEQMLPSMLYQEFNKKNGANLSDRDLNSASKTFGLQKEIDEKVSGRSEDADKAAALKTKNEIIEKLLPFFYYNFIINQYSASQIVYGDEAFYKNKEDETKRIQIATATGDTLLSDGVYGLPKRSKILVIKDVEGTVPSDLKGAIDSSFRDSYDTTDAEGFVLPEYYERIAVTYGTEAMVDVVLKPVYFSVENGIPTAVKYSAKVLTDEFVAQYPHLEKLRQTMRNKGVDQAVFASAVKVGMPKQIASMNKSGVIDETTVSDNAILDVDSNMLRFQLNPAKSPDVTTRNPSQLTAFMNTNGMNQEEIAELHRLNARIIENGRRLINRLLRLTPKGSLTGKSIRAIKKWIKDSTEGLAGAMDLHRLMAYRGRNGEEVSMDLPLIAERAVAAMASMISDSTVGFRFDGSKLVLQADIGVHKIFGESKPRELKWRDDEGYAEVILPETYKKFIREGESFIPGLQNGLVGFRIPSTNYHSAIPMKVVGFYPVPKGAKGNLIIAPSLIVYYHGSDYDVDTLFVMRKQVWNRESVDLNEIVRAYSPDHVDSPALVLEKDKSVPGFNGEGKLLVGKLPIEDYLQGTAVKLSQTIEKLTDLLLNPKILPVKKKEIEEEIKVLNQQFETVSEVIDASAKNSIVHLFSTNMLDMKNRKDLLTPISFARVAGIKSKTQKELSSLLTDEDFLQELANAGLIEFKCESV